jgi:NifB/MoaA-like Fe-S oxidoreductase
MLRSFAEEFSMAWEDIADMKDSITEKREVSVVTGKASYPMIKSLCDRLMSFAPALTVNVYEIKNYFYGESITVSGLLTGKDISEQLMGKRLGEELFVPENCLKSDEDVFLCGMTLAELSRNLSVKISVSENDGYEFVRSILGLE